jgi:hypothetical protein
MKRLYRRNLDYLNTAYLSFKDKNISNCFAVIQIPSLFEKWLWQVSNIRVWRGIPIIILKKLL